MGNISFLFGEVVVTFNAPCRIYIYIHNCITHIHSLSYGRDGRDWYDRFIFRSPFNTLCYLGIYHGRTHGPLYRASRKIKVNPRLNDSAHQTIGINPVHVFPDWGIVGRI